VPVPDLLALPESITKTLAICVRCGSQGKHTQRLRGSEDLIVVWAADVYEARCRRCFEPGIPKQRVLPLALRYPPVDGRAFRRRVLDAGVVRLRKNRDNV